MDANKEATFALVLIDLPLSLLILAGPVMTLASFLSVYLSKLWQEKKAKCASVLFIQNNPNLINFYKRYGICIDFSTMTGIFAFIVILAYALWMPFWIMERNMIQGMEGYTWRLTVIHVAFWLLIISHWTFFLKNIVGLIKVESEIKSQTLTFKKHLSEHKLFSIVPCDTRIAKIQARFLKYRWLRIQRRIGDNEKITGKALFNFFKVNNLAIDALAPYLVSNAKELGLNINPAEGNWYVEQLNMKFKDAEEKRLTPHEVLDIARDYFASMSFAPNLAISQANQLNKLLIY